jgi:uncharacterized membrane protein
MDEFVEVVLNIFLFAIIASVVVVIGLVSLTAGALYGAFITPRNYAVALQNNINTESAAPGAAATGTGEPAIKSYFFGKGYRDLTATIADCHKANLKFYETAWQSGAAAGFGVMQAVHYAAAFSCLIYGTAFFGVLSLLHAILLGAVLVAIYLLFSIVLTVEKVYLALHGFFMVCPACHTKAALPVYRCDSCGAKHHQLIPSSYGIFRHTCVCGQILPATFFLNRGRLPAICSVCEHSLSRAHIETQKVFVPVIGGPSTGKTAYLVWLVDALQREAISVGQSVEFLDTRHQTEHRAQITAMRAGQMPAKTVETTPRAVNLNFTQADQSHLNLYLYDPAGEAFGDGNLLTPLQFLSYCSGILLLIDPFSITSVLAKYGLTSQSAADIRPSLQQPDELLDRLLFILERHFGLDPAASIPAPVAVVLTKVDAFDLETVVGDATLPTALTEDERAAARSARISRQLRDWGMIPLVEVIERRFANACFFSCSSVGSAHKAGTSFSPLRIEEPFLWLMRKAKTGLLSPDPPALTGAAQLDLPGGSGSGATGQMPRRKVILSIAILALLTAGAIAAKLHLDDEAAYTAATGDLQGLNAYLSSCRICWHGDDARREIASLAAPRHIASADDDEGYRNARGDAEGLRNYLSTCKVCTHGAEATEAIRDLDRVKASEEDRTYQSARGNAESLQRYLNFCRICAHRADALGEIETLQQQQLATSEMNAYQSARGNLDGLRSYVNSCKVCARKLAALSEIHGLEAQASYFSFEACNSTRYLVSVAVMGRRNSTSDQWTVQGWWTVSSGACTAIGKFVKGNIYLSATVYGEQRGWFGTDTRQCVLFAAFERIAVPDINCSGGRTLGFRNYQVTTDQYQFRVMGEPEWPEDTFFSFQVCNQSDRWAAVAIMGREAPDSNQWIVQGWWQVAPYQCSNIGRYVRGAFYAMAEHLNAPGRWTNNNIMLCVEHPGPFRRINTPNSACLPNDLVPFRGFQVTQATETWNLLQ